jgi:hypothetical protein
LLLLSPGLLFSSSSPLLIANICLGSWRISKDYFL